MERARLGPDFYGFLRSIVPNPGDGMWYASTQTFGNRLEATAIAVGPDCLLAVNGVQPMRPDGDAANGRPRLRRAGAWDIDYVKIPFRAGTCHVSRLPPGSNTFAGGYRTGLDTDPLLAAELSNLPAVVQDHLRTYVPTGLRIRRWLRSVGPTTAEPERLWLFTSSADHLAYVHGARWHHGPLRSGTRPGQRALGPHHFDGPRRPGQPGALDPHRERLDLARDPYIASSCDGPLVSLGMSLGAVTVLPRGYNVQVAFAWLRASIEEEPDLGNEPWLGSRFVSMGETLHVAGADGVQRAKDWLERTGRVEVWWTSYEHKTMLTVQRPAGGERSFDLGGVIKGGDLDGHLFYAEVKKYSNIGGQPDMYKQYLATCYCMLLHDPNKLLEFMWITWHPFNLSRWARLCSAEEVSAAVTELKDQWLGAGVDVDANHCYLVASRLWLIVLSDQQERLSMSDQMLAEVRRAATLGTKP